MQKILRISTAILFCVLCIGIVGIAEEITLTTYYPAPYGAYEELTVSKGFLPPKFTTAQRDAISSPDEGSFIYNTSTDSYNFYNGTDWQALGGGIKSVQWGNGTAMKNSIRHTFAHGSVDVSKSVLLLDGSSAYTIGPTTAWAQSIYIESRTATSFTIKPSYGSLFNRDAGISWQLIEYE